MVEQVVERHQRDWPEPARAAPGVQPNGRVSFGAWYSETNGTSGPLGMLADALREGGSANADTIDFVDLPPGEIMVMIIPTGERGALPTCRSAAAAASAARSSRA